MAAPDALRIVAADEGPPTKLQEEGVTVPVPEESQSSRPEAWALERATDELYDEGDPAVIVARAWELMRAAQDLEDERHDEYDDPDEGGEA